MQSHPHGMKASFELDARGSGPHPGIGSKQACLIVCVGGGGCASVVVVVVT